MYQMWNTFFTNETIVIVNWKIHKNQSSVLMAELTFHFTKLFSWEDARLVLQRYIVIC